MVLNNIMKQFKMGVVRSDASDGKAEDSGLKGPGFNPRSSLVLLFHSVKGTLHISPNIQLIYFSLNLKKWAL